MQTAPLLTFAVFLAGLYWLTQQALQTEGSGGGAISTDTGEGADLADNLTAAAAGALLGSGSRNMSGTGLDMLRRLEGFSATPYADHKGFSIGYGHLIKPGENLARVTELEAAQLLAQDVSWAEDAVSSAITVDLAQGQYDALVSFAFNVGAGAFRRSTLVRRINAGDPGAAAEFDRWVYASGTVQQALINRRRIERNTFEEATA